MSIGMLTLLQTAVSTLTAVAPLFAVLAVGALLGMSIRTMFQSVMSEEAGADTRSDAGREGHDEQATDGLDRGTAGGGGDGGPRDSKSRDVDSGGFGNEATDRSAAGGGTGGDGGVLELEDRLEDLETEVGTLSATMDTVRKENDQIARSVAALKGNVRTLLGGSEDRGGSPGQGSSKGMADGDGQRVDEGKRDGEREGRRERTAEGEGDGESASAESDDAVTAEAFFDDSVAAERLRPEPGREERPGADAEDRPTGGSTVDEESEAAREGDGDTDEGRSLGDFGSSDKTTFAELKAEYEPGDLEWIDDAADDSEASEEDADGDADDRETMSSFADLTEDYEFGEFVWVEDAPDEAGDETPTGGPEKSAEAGDEADDKTSFADLKDAYESGDIEWAEAEGDQADSEDGAERKLDEAGGTAAEVHGETGDAGSVADDQVAEGDGFSSGPNLATGDESSAAVDTASEEEADLSGAEGCGDATKGIEWGSASADSVVDDTTSEQHDDWSGEIELTSAVVGDTTVQVDETPGHADGEAVKGEDTASEPGHPAAPTTDRSATEERGQAADEGGNAEAEEAADEEIVAPTEETGSPPESPAEALADGPDWTGEPGGDAREGSERAESTEKEEPVAERQFDETTEQVSEERGSEQGTSPEAGKPASVKPYLEILPEGYWADLIVIEWLDFLVGEGGPREARRALEYYESIGWIDGEVRDDLARYLRGFDEEVEGTLTIDHHQQSLSYITQLNGGGTGAEMLL
ncbi:MAG: FlaD/FlaE family flagellar protein [Haloarculaceae archaeon]